MGANFLSGICALTVIADKEEMREASTVIEDHFEGVWKKEVVVRPKENTYRSKKSIISDRRAKSWELHDGAEDGYENAVMDSSSDSTRTSQRQRLSMEVEQPQSQSPIGNGSLWRNWPLLEVTFFNV